MLLLILPCEEPEGAAGLRWQDSAVRAGGLRAGYGRYGRSTGTWWQTRSAMVCEQGRRGGGRVYYLPVLLLASLVPAFDEPCILSCDEPKSAAGVKLTVRRSTGTW